MEKFLTTAALVFLLASIFNVILHTIKSIVTVQGTTLSAALINAITFGFYTCIVKLISNTDLIISVPLTIIANFAGVYIARWLLELFKKDKVWRISCTFPKEKEKILNAFELQVDEYNIKYLKFPYEGGTIVDIFSKTQGESTLIKEIIEKNNLKYSIYELDKSL